MGDYGLTRLDVILISPSSWTTFGKPKDRSGKRYSEDLLFRRAREKHGGDIGIKAWQDKDRIARQEQKTMDRINAYGDE